MLLMLALLTFFVFLEIWQDDLVVHYGRSIVINWYHAPDEEDALHRGINELMLHLFKLVLDYDKSADLPSAASRMG